MNETTKTIRIAHAIDVSASPEAAWAVVADYSRDTEWRTGVRSMTVEPPGSLEEGAVTIEELRFAGKTYRNVGEITALEPGRELRWRTTQGADADGRRRVTARADGRCRISLELTVRPTGADRLFAPVLARMLARNVRRDLERLRQLVEGHVAQPTTSADAEPSLVTAASRPVR
jgi:uncharacterized membrane protein